MKRKIYIWQFIGFALVSLGGTLLHFLYDLTESKFAALFSGVNESTWEHMKLLFFPAFLFTVIESIWLSRECDGFWWIKLRGSLLGLIMIPILFYTINGAFGKTPDFVNIIIFFVSVAAEFIYETVKFRRNDKSLALEGISIAAFFIISVLFFMFTFNTPNIPLFLDPVTQTFGI